MVQPIHLSVDRDVKQWCRQLSLIQFGDHHHHHLRVVLIITSLLFMEEPLPG